MSFIVLLPASLALATAAVFLERRTSFWIATIPIVGILVLHGGLYFGVTADDAFISFRYAENLAVGHGPVWNTGERVEGYTNFLWVLLLSLPAALDASLVVSSQVMGVLASVGVFAAVYGLARVWTAPIPSDDQCRGIGTCPGIPLGEMDRLSPSGPASLGGTGIQRSRASLWFGGHRKNHRRPAPGGFSSPQ